MVVAKKDATLCWGCGPLASGTGSSETHASWTYSGAARVARLYACGMCGWQQHVNTGACGTLINECHSSRSIGQSVSHYCVHLVERWKPLNQHQLCLQLTWHGGPARGHWLPVCNAGNSWLLRHSITMTIHNPVVWFRCSVCCQVT